MADVTSCENALLTGTLIFLGGGVGVLCTTTTGGVFTSLRSEGTLPLALVPDSLRVH